MLVKLCFGPQSQKLICQVKLFQEKLRVTVEKKYLMIRSIIRHIILECFSKQHTRPEVFPQINVYGVFEPDGRDKDSKIRESEMDQTASDVYECVGGRTNSAKWQ